MLSCRLARCASAAIIVVAVAGVALGAPVPAARAASSAPVLTEGTGLGAKPSVRVRRVQRILKRRGFDLGPPGVDGRFGPRTAAAVRRMQSRYGLVADGVVGPKTRRVLALIERAQQRTRTTTQPPRQAPAQQSAPTAPKTTQPQPQRTPPAQTVGRAAPASNTGGESTLPIVLAAIAAALAAAALAVVVMRYRHRSQPGAPALAAIDRDVYVEGDTERAGIGAFRGFALATAVPPDGSDDPQRTRYLVDDPRKPAPVWVEGSEIRRSPSQLRAGESVIGYVTVDEDPARQEAAFLEIEAACEHAGWKLEEIVRDRDTGRMVGRPGLTTALERIAAGEARALVVSQARDLIHSLGDLGALLEWFRDARAALVALDLDLDTATIPGYQTASTLISVAGWESERRANRARRGLTRVQTPERGTRPPTAEERAALIERIRAMREAGMSRQAIADQLTSENIAPLRGNRWSPASITAALEGTPRRRTVRDQLPDIPTQNRQG